MDPTPNTDSPVPALVDDWRPDREEPTRLFHAGTQPIQRFADSQPVADLLMFPHGAAGRD